MSNTQATTARSIQWALALAGLATLFAIVAARFAAQQSVWTDESTQLSGLSLGFVDQLRWLTGHLPHMFAVPPDRTPPLSYWLGSVWALAFGSGVLTTRYLSICLSVGSIFILWATARQYLQRRMALACAALLAFSPNFIFLAAEIRAYAAFILFSILLVHGYLRLVASGPTPSRLELWAFAIEATLCSYTHFFGVMISAGAFACILAHYLTASSRAEGLEILRKARWPLMLYAAAFAGLVPFILSAIKNSGGGDISSAIPAPSFSHVTYEVFRLVYRFFSHQSMLGVPGLSVIALLAGLTLMVFAATPGSHPRCKALLFFLLVNLTLASILNMATGAFAALAPTYNVWALPVIALLAASDLSHRNRYIRRASMLCVGALLVADGYGAIKLATDGNTYSHTRSTEVQIAVDHAGVSNAIVLYANDAPSTYFALMYGYGGRLRQFIDRGSSIQMIGPFADESPRSICDLNASTLLVVSDQQLLADELQFMVAHAGVHTQAYYTLDKFLQTHRESLASKWILASKNEYLAQTALALAVFKERATDLSSNTTNCIARLRLGFFGGEPSSEQVNLGNLNVMPKVIAEATN